MKRIALFITAFCLGAILALLAGCSNTIHATGGLLRGIGTDVQRAMESDEIDARYYSQRE